METTAIRRKWDNTFSPEKVRLFARVFSACCVFFASFALAQLFPFLILFNSPGIAVLLISLVAAVAMFFNQNLGVFCFAIVMLLSMPAGQPAAGLFATVALLLIFGNSRFICSLAVLVPWLAMNIEGAPSWLLSLGLVYFIFLVCVFFNGKAANSTWKYFFPVYFSLAAYNFGAYSVITDNYLIKWSEERVNAGDFNAMDYFVESTGFNEAFTSLNYTELIIIVLINLAICIILYKIIGNSSLKYLSLQVDLRDAIVFAAGILLTCAGAFAISRFVVEPAGLRFVAIIIQGVVAYLLTRPLASYKVCSALGTIMSPEEEEEIKGTLEVNEYGMSTKAAILGAVKTYISKKQFDTILKADRIPVNCILVIGDGNMDLSLAVRNALKEESVNDEYYEGEDLCDEFLAGEESRCFRKEFSSAKLNVIVVNNIDAFISSDKIGGQLRSLFLESLASYLDSKKRDSKVLFIFTTHRPDMIPGDLFNESCINKIIYAKESDSILLNNTYRLIKTIGKGGGGLVYKANHERLDTPVVVKQIISDSIGNKAEADILKNLKHSSIPKVYDVFEEDGRYYTVMDFVPGSDMQAVIDARGKIDEKSAVRWGIQLADAVAYLHSQAVPILHSDIKPGNIMLMPDGNISLIDFNISLAFGKRNESIGVTMGYSPIEQYGNLYRYLATLRAVGFDENAYVEQSVSPEEIEAYETSLLTAYGESKTLSDEETTSLIWNLIPDFETVSDKTSLLLTLDKCAERGLSKQSDIYSIGATLYAMVTGVKPSPAFGFITPIRELAPECSRGLCAVIEKTMNIDPKDRYASAEELKEALMSIQ